MFKDLDDELTFRDLCDGVVTINGDIEDFEVQQLLQELNQIRRKVKPGGKIQINITSSGGDVYPALAMYDVIRSMSPAYDITTIAIGHACSAAAMIVLQAGDERAATPNTRFLLHEVSHWSVFSNDTTSQIEERLVEMNALTDQVMYIMEHKCHKSADEIKSAITKTELWMGADQALSWGLIDRIVS